MTARHDLAPGPARIARGFAVAVSAVFWIAVGVCLWVLK